MLILTRKAEQGIVIDGNVVVRVLGIDGERVKLGIEAPAVALGVAEELLVEVAGENQAARFDGRRGLARASRGMERPSPVTSA